MPDQYFYKGERVQIIRRIGNVCIISTANHTVSVNIQDLIVLPENQQDLNQLDNLNNLISLTALKQEKEEKERQTNVLTVSIGSPPPVENLVTTTNPETVSDTESPRQLYINELSLDTDLFRLAKEYPGITRVTLINLLNCRPAGGYKDIPDIKEQFSQHGIKSNINWKILEQVLVF